MTPTFMETIHFNKTKSKPAGENADFIFSTHMM